MSFLIILYLVLVIALPLVLSAVVSYRTLPDGDDCPLCGDDTLRLRSRWLRWTSAVKPGARLQRRWCLGCGWEGISRLVRTETAPRAVDAQPGPTRSPDTQRESGRPDVHSRDRKAIDLRKLEVDGQRWRVMLETWCDAGGWYGRLLFGGPSGRLWTDRQEVFRGPSPLDVLGQALSLSDRVLVHRVRDVTSNA